jgi:hypothetical protein
MADAPAGCAAGDRTAVGLGLGGSPELLPGWEDYLLLATCPLCHLLVIWFARHHLMYNEEAGTLRDL